MSKPQKASKTSIILQGVIDSAEKGGTISIGEFMTHLGDRAFYMAILIFSLPNSLPVPGIPGFSTITGLPISFIALQLVLGRHTIWLPKKVAEKRFSRQGLAKLLSKALPAVIWLERFLKPRWRWVNSPLSDRLIALLVVVLSLIIALPIPGANFLPGLSMSLIALGMLEKDGIFLLVAIALALAAITFMYQVIVLFFKTAIAAADSFF